MEENTKENEHIEEVSAEEATGSLVSKNKERGLIIEKLKSEKITDGKIQMITGAFEPMLNKLRELDEEYADILTQLEAEGPTKELCEKARSLRLKMVHCRGDVKGVHKSQKEETIRYNRAVDGVKNIFDFAVTSKEEKLSSIENHFEELEKERLAAIKAVREEKLKAFNYDASSIDLSKVEESMFNLILNGAEKAFNDKIAADKKAEEEKKLQEEKEKQELADKLKKEAEEKLAAEKKKKEEDEKAALLKVQQEEIQKLNADRFLELVPYNTNANVIDLGNMSEDVYLKLLSDSKIKHESDLKEKEIARKAQEKKDAELKAQKEANEKLQKELKEKEDAEKKKKEKDEADKKAKIAADKKAAKAPDKTKMIAWIDSIQLPDVVVKEQESKDVASSITQKFNAFKKWAKLEVDKI